MKLKKLNTSFLKYLDPILAFQLVFPIAMLIIFLITPLVSVLMVALEYNPMNVFTDKTFISLNPRGQLLFTREVSFRGEDILLIKLQGVSFGAILNSIINASIVTLCATIIGVLVAFVLARYSFPGRNVLRVIATIPLLMTPFINAFVIKKMFDWRDGLISWFLNDVLHLPIRIGVESLAGVALAQIITFSPIVYLNTHAAMVNIDPSLEEQAENLGAKGFRLFRTVTLPLSLPGIAAGAALVFIFSLEDVAGPIVFNEPRLMSYQIFSMFLEATTGQLSPAAATLALLMLVIALIAFMSIKRYVSLRQYAMLSRGGRWKPRFKKLDKKGLLFIYLVFLPMLLFFAFPQIGVFIYAFAKHWRGALPEGFTFEHMASIVDDPVVFKGLINSLQYSALALILIILLGVSASYVASRLSHLPGIDILDMLVTMPIALPGLVIAVGYFFFFKDTPLSPITMGPAILLPLAYSVRRLPFTARAVFAGLQQLHIALEEAAMNLGASRLKVLRDVVLPLVGLNILSGALISFVYCMSEVSVSITLGGLKGIGEQHQAPLTFVMKDYITRVGGPHIVAALGVLLISVQIAIIVIVNYVLKQRYAFIGV